MGASERWSGRRARTWQAVRDDRGSALVEFTLVLPLLLAMTFGVTQYGLLLFVWNNMYDAARTAARDLAVGTATAAEAKATATALLATWPQTWSVVAQDVDVTGTTNVRVVITVPAAEASIIGFVPMPNQLRAEVVFRKE